jgi:hypothetical protein
MREEDNHRKYLLEGMPYEGPESELAPPREAHVVGLSPCSPW